MTIKTLALGILCILVVGIGGFIYRNAVEHPSQPIACPLDAKVCPDGSTFGRIGTSCAFPVCLPPNVSLDAIGLAFALPTGFHSVTPDNPAAIAQYEHDYASSTPTDATLAPSTITILRYPIAASSTALMTIQKTAIGGASGAPISATSYSNANIGQHHFTVVPIERFESTIDMAYYLARENDVLRFDAIDRGGFDWTNPSLDVTKLPAEVALRAMLATLQGQ